MKYAIFLGCTVAGRARHYEMAVSKVAERLGIELVYLDDFACCGFPVRSIDFLSAVCLAARNLSVAEAAGLNIATLCSACTASLPFACLPSAYILHPSIFLTLRHSYNLTLPTISVKLITLQQED